MNDFCSICLFLKRYTYTCNIITLLISMHLITSHLSTSITSPGLVAVKLHTRTLKLSNQNTIFTE